MKQRSLEWQLLVLVTLALTAFGLIMVYSATSASAALGNGNPTGYLERQGIYALLGFALLVIAAPSYRTVQQRCTVMRHLVRCGEAIEWLPENELAGSCREE